MDIYPEENIIKALTHERHGNDTWTRVGDGSTPITKRDWNSGFLNKKEKIEAVIFQQHTYFQGWHGRTLLMSIRFETLAIAPHHCNDSEADTPVYDTYDKAWSCKSLCSHCCQSSGWTSVKSPYHLLRYLPVNPLALRLSLILTVWGTSQLFGWGKTQHKQHGQALHC